MKSFCETCGVDFTSDMCSWEGGEQEHFKKWAGFHVRKQALVSLCHANAAFQPQDDAQESTGIAKPAGDEEARAAKEAKKAKEAAEMPEAVHTAIAENMEAYEYLRARASACKA